MIHSYSTRLTSYMDEPNKGNKKYATDDIARRQRIPGNNVEIFPIFPSVFHNCQDLAGILLQVLYRKDSSILIWFPDEMQQSVGKQVCQLYDGLAQIKF